MYNTGKETSLGMLVKTLPDITGILPAPITLIRRDITYALTMQTPVSISGENIQAASCGNGYYSFAWYEAADYPEHSASEIVWKSMEGSYIIDEISPRIAEKDGYLKDGSEIAVRFHKPDEILSPRTLIQHDNKKEIILAFTLLGLHQILNTRHGKGILTRLDADVLSYFYHG